MFKKTLCSKDKTIEKLYMNLYIKVFYSRRIWLKMWQQTETNPMMCVSVGVNKL